MTQNGYKKTQPEFGSESIFRPGPGGSTPLRLPPANADAEMALLGALLCNNKVLDRASFLEPKHFADPINGIIFGEARRLIGERRVADAVTLKTVLESTGILDDVGGAGYLASLITATVGIINASDYAAVVRDTWLRREMIDIGETIVNNAFTPEPGDDGLKLAMRAVAMLDAITASANSMSDHSSSLDTAVEAALEQMRMARLNGKPPGISTGLRCLDARLGGLEPGLVYTIAGRPGSGKAQPLDAKVLCANGTWKTIGDLRFGDPLASIDGATSMVSAVHERGERAVFRVTFSDGRSTEVCGDHLWRVMYRDWSEARVLTTDQLRLMLQRKRYHKRLSIEIVSGHFGLDEALPLDPYVLGALLGDGSFRTIPARLTAAEPEIVTLVQERLGEATEVRRVMGSYAYSLTSRGLPGRLIEDGSPQFRRIPYVGLEHLGSRNFWPRTVYPVQRAIEALGLAGKGSESKFIPEVYLSASRYARLELLRGLMDTDGSAGAAGGVEFSSCSRSLAEGVQTLVRSLGGLCAIAKRQTTCVVNGKSLVCLPSYRCNIRHPHSEQFFALKRKSLRAVRGRNAWVSLNVLSIEASRVTATRCISVTHPSELYITDDYIVTHNSSLGHQIALSAANQGYGVLELSLEMSATQLGRRTLSSISGVPLFVMKGGQATQEEIDRLHDAQTRLRGLPLTIDDAGGQTPRQIAAKCRAAKRKKSGLGLVMLDHLNLTRPDDNDAKHGPTFAIERAAGMMLQIAKDCEVPVIMLTQLNRGLEGRDDKRPNLSDLRQSGAIEENSYAVGLLYREEYYLQNAPEQKENENDSKFNQRYNAWVNHRNKVAGKADVIWGKVRDGSTGTDSLLFDGRSTSFSEESV